MDRARIHEGIGQMRFTDVPGGSERSELSQMEAVELPGIGGRHSGAGVTTIAMPGALVWTIAA